VQNLFSTFVIIAVATTVISPIILNQVFSRRDRPV